MRISGAPLLKLNSESFKRRVLTQGFKLTKVIQELL